MTPLNVLLSRALLDLTRSCEQRGAVEVVLWSNLLRVVDDNGVQETDLPAQVRLSKRAVRSTLTCMRRRQWVDDHGDGVVRMTADARRSADAWGRAIAEAESGWPAAAMLRRPLEEFVAALPLEHPHYPCGYGTADWRITGGPGVDWKPVQREARSVTPTPVSTLALLSQALVGFSIEYESRVPFALLVGVHFDAAFADGAVDLTDAPDALGIKGNGKSSLERHGAVVVDASQAILTGLGRSVRDAYRPTVEAVESTMAAAPPLRHALEAVEHDHSRHALHPDIRYVGSSVGFAEVSGRH